jgi:NTE family protein
MPLSDLIKRRAPAPASRTALVLMGGGARTAYQVGVLKGIGQLLRDAAHSGAVTGHPTGDGGSGGAFDSAAPHAFPFHILVGTSAGALNATHLASQAAMGLAAFDNLAELWLRMRSHHVYRLNAPQWAQYNLLTAGWVLAKQVKVHRALLDTSPLVDTLHKAIQLQAIEDAIDTGTIDALAVTTSSYTSGTHWTFVQTKPTLTPQPWRRVDRRADMQPITIEHLMASSAIPFLFGAIPLWVDGHREYFGDGSMRQTAPLSPAIHLGANRVLAIGAGKPIDMHTDQGKRVHAAQGEPTAGVIASHALASVFQDTLHGDADQAMRMTEAARALNPAQRQALPYRPIDVLAINPSESLDEIALRHTHLLPKATRAVLMGLGALNNSIDKPSHNAASLASYLMFEPGFIHSLVALGEHDARLNAQALKQFFAVP